MRTALRVIGWTAFVFVAWMLSVGVVVIYGRTFGALIAACCSGAAWAMHTERSARLIGMFRRALARVGISEKAAAIAMDVPTSLVSGGFNGTEQLSFSRAASIDDAAWEQFAVDLLNASGKYVVLERGLIADCVLSNLSLHEGLKQASDPLRPQLAFSADRKVAS